METYQTRLKDTKHKHDFFNNLLLCQNNFVDL